MLWIIIAIVAYFFLAAVAVVDEILLTKRLIRPKVYTFYVGLLRIFALVLVPFGFTLPNPPVLALALLSGAVSVFGILALFRALEMFEVSRVIPAIGGFLPLFTLSLTFLFSWQTGGSFEGFGYLKIVSFILLITGSVLVSQKKEKRVNRKSLAISALAAFMFALSFATAKIVFMDQSFISGLIWLQIGGVLVAVSFLFFKEVRQELFKKAKSKKKRPLFQRPRTATVVVLNQIMGAGAGVLQYLAIYLAPVIYLAFINALEGVRYVFLLILTIILSFQFPKILFEKMTRPIILRKVLAIFLIISGLIILAITQ